MGKGKKAENTDAVLLKRLYGVKSDTGEKMRSILQREYDALRQKGGKPPKLTVEDKLYSTLKYLREYRRMDRIAAEYGVCKGTVCLSIQWVEDILVKDGTCALPGKKVLKRKSASIKYVVGDVRERPINRPQKNQKAYYVRKKKTAHAETQVIIERNSLCIIAVQEAKGHEHDFKVYKETIGKDLSNSIPLDADLGYRGIERYHANSFIPIKSSKNHQLTKREKAYNMRLSRRRVVIEHSNGRIKVCNVWHILTGDIVKIDML